MTSTYDIEPDPIENGVQQVYMADIRESLELILVAELSQIPTVNAVGLCATILNSLDDAISNNWDDLMVTFWRGVRQDIDLITGDNDGT